MSFIGPSAQDMVGLLATSQSIYIQNICAIASCTLVIYDHICTLPGDIELIWGRNFTSTILLFHLNRAASLIWAVINVLQFLPLATLPSCETTRMLHHGVVIVLLTTWAAFSAIRVYAMSGGNRALPLLVFLLSMVPVAINSYNFFSEQWFSVSMRPIIGSECVSGNSLSEAEVFKLALMSRLCLIAADIIVLLNTWRKTWSIVGMAREHNFETPLISMLLRDGTYYFTILLTLNIINIVGFRTGCFIYTGYFTTSMSSIIISHFLLNLRQLAYPSQEDWHSRPSFVRDMPLRKSNSLPSLRFGSFVGNMGEPLVHESWTPANRSVDQKEGLPDEWCDSEVYRDAADAKDDSTLSTSTFTSVVNV